MLSIDEVKQVDRAGLHREYEDWPTHSRRAVEMKVKVPDLSDVDRIIFAGMGGSGTTGDILNDWLKPSIMLPMMVLKDYHLPRCVNERTFVLSISASGNTEEVVSIVREALSVEAKIAAVSSGGLLEKLCAKRNIPFTKIKSLLVPRVTFPYLFYTSSKVLLEGGLIVDQEGEIADSIETIEKVSHMIRVETSVEDNLAKKIAVWINGTLPIIYTSPLTRGVGIRFKDSLNENAKMHAHTDTLPELCHNEIVSWESSSEFLCRPIMIRYDGEPPEVKERFEVVKKLIERDDREVFELWCCGKTPLSRILSALYILDFASLYTSVLRRLDPVPTRSIDILKSELKTRLNYLNTER